MPCGMAADINRNGQPGDMRGVTANMNCKSRCFAAQSGGANPQRVDLIQKFPFKTIPKGVGIVRSHIAKQRLFCDQTGLFHRPTDTDSDDNGGAWIRTCYFYGFNNKGSNSLDSL